MKRRLLILCCFILFGSIALEANGPWGSCSLPSYTSQDAKTKLYTTDCPSVPSNGTCDLFCTLHDER